MNNITLKYINNINSVFKKDQFILSALNLSFLYFFANKTIQNQKNLVLWPDGFYAKILTKSKKIAGSQLIKNLKLPNNIKKIFVIGNLHFKEKNFLKKKFKVNIEFNKLPVDKSKQLKKKIIANFNKDDLVLITLPTPKQEEIAQYINKKFQIKKIICIGGGLAIASGRIPECPNFLRKINLEFIWRLRTDTLRRLKRLMTSFLIYYYLNFFNLTKKLNFKRV